MCIDEFNGDNFDHGPHGFVGGGYMGQVQTNGRPIESDARAARHAELGRGMEERGARQLSQHGEAGHRRARQLLQLPRRLSRSRPDLQGPVRPAADAHDDRLPRQRAEAERIPDRPVRRDHQGDGRASRSSKQYRDGALRHHRIPDDASERRRHHGRRSRRPARSTAICRAGTCRTCSCMGASAFPQNAGYNPTGTVARARLSGRPTRSATNI